MATAYWWQSLATYLGPSIPALCIFINVVVILANLMPRHFHVFGHQQRSDGLALVEIPRTPEKKLRVYLHSAPLIRGFSRFEKRDYRGAERCLERAFTRDTSDASLAIMKSACRIHLSDFAAARRSLEPVLKRLPSEEPQVRAVVLNNMACALMMEEPEAGAESESLKQADLFSAEAFGMYPCVLAYRSTRAFVLSAIGRCDEGLELLDYVHYRTATPKERSNQEATQAFALHKAGRASEAHQSAHAAARLDHKAVPELIRLNLLSLDCGARIIVFDGYCHLCSGWARFHPRHPARSPFNLVAAQSPRGRGLLTLHGINPDDPTTFLVLDAGRTFTQSDAAIEVMIASGGLWRLASLARWLPRRLRDGLYGLVARNRYRWFGKRASCYLPP
ncbi:MAG TPA: DCC1-like thiol-disulfide oxidoreductase family protein [Steroidobacteraceae bacterium]|jgi:predicted DCC family thiol-disulfide oxidoreductase YuxK|nr:DCC1-like thiol-disulfide oxidoreductase family protein [Steroidobacteraceae bacterium]